VHPIQIGIWKKKLLDEMERIFSDNDKRDKEKERKFIDELYKQIGKKDIEIEWLKKKVGLLE
jgi:hypothetical protein